MPTIDWNGNVVERRKPPLPIIVAIAVAAALLAGALAATVVKGCASDKTEQEQPAAGLVQNFTDLDKVLVDGTYAKVTATGYCMTDGNTVLRLEVENKSGYDVAARISWVKSGTGLARIDLEDRVECKAGEKAEGTVTLGSPGEDGNMLPIKGTVSILELSSEGYEGDTLESDDFTCK